MFIPAFQMSSIPFTITQKYPIYQDDQGTLILTINNESEQAIIIKVLTCKSMSQNILLNQIIFPVKSQNIEKVICVYRPPCKEPHPRLAFQAFYIGDQDEILFDANADNCKHYWDNNVQRAKNNGNYFELMFPINFQSGKIPQIEDPRDRNIMNLETLRQLEERYLLKDQEYNRIQNELFSQIEVVSREKAEYEKECATLQQLERKSHEIDIVGFKIDWKQTFLFIVVLVAFVGGWKLRTRK